MGLKLNFQWVRSNDHSRIIVIKKHKTDSFGQEKSSSAKSKEGCSYISLLNFTKITVLECTMLLLQIIWWSHCNGIFFFFIFPFLTSSQASMCRLDCWLWYLFHQHILKVFWGSYKAECYCLGINFILMRQEG